MNPPMNPNNYLIAMLDKYCEWLNLWIDAEAGDDPPRHYTPEQFLVHQPYRDLYGSGRINAIIPTGGSSAFDRVLVEATVTDGDEGGPTDLTAWFELDTVNGTNPMIALIQGFDTQLQFIYNDGKFVSTPTERIR